MIIYYSLGREQMANLFLIKDLAHISGFSIHTLKYYLKEGLIHEVERTPETNYRFFNNDTVQILEKIRELRRQKLPIREIKVILQ
jgi:DNA-binding transcriptional MerR regulator